MDHMNNKPISNKTLWGFAFILSLGFIIAAAIMGYAFKQSTNNKNSITVKGLAEKPIQADLARWEINYIGYPVRDSISEAYQQLDQQVKVIQKFFIDHGFKADEIQINNKSSQPAYEDIDIGDGRTRQQLAGYRAKQSIIINSRDIAKVAKAAKDIYVLDEQGLSIDEKPQYLVSNLEEIKMSLIANATKNAYSRANEFAKVGGVKVSTMRSASQGAFYILPENGSDEDSDYGGAYDKNTIQKIARVVVTINYAID